MKGFRRFWLRSMVGTLVLTTAACYGPTAPKTAQTQLTEARRMWNSVAESGSYRMEQGLTCECLPATTNLKILHVQSREIIGLWDAETGSALDLEFAIPHLTVKELFDLAQTAIDAGYDQLDATYHMDLGYPTNLVIDPDLNVGDDERGFTITVTEITANR